MAGKLMVCYEAMARASRAMLNAARDNDWDTVASLERHCAGVIAQLGTEAGTDSLDDTQRRRRFEILRTLLAEDAEIRNLAQPWLRQAQSLLGRYHARARGPTHTFAKSPRCAPCPARS